jgi:opacity protein-like surface antigen
MKTRLFLVLTLAAGIAAPAAAQTEPKFGGYLSAEYLHAQVSSGGREGSFENARGGVLFSGDWTPRFGFALEFVLDAAGPVKVEQAWALVRASDAFQVRAGLYLVPFGRYNESRRAYQTTLVLDPYPVGDLLPASWRDIGAVLEGRIGRLHYAAHIGNGLAEGETLAAGQQFRDNNKNKGHGMRATFSLSETLEIGGSYYLGLADAANSRREKLWGADLVWGTEGFRLVGEYVKAEIRNPEPFAAGEAEGYFLILTFKLGPLTPLVAYEALAYDDPFHGTGFAGPEEPGEGIARDEVRWALGFVYPLHPNVLLKFEYDWNREKGLKVRNNVLRIQAAIHF